mgnify:FL=1
MRVENLMQNKSKLIRMGLYPDNPALLRQWLNQEPKEMADEASRTAHYEQQFELLLATVMDSKVAKQWRISCLDQIFLPIRTLQSWKNSDLSAEAVSRMLQLLSVNRTTIENELYL